MFDSIKNAIFNRNRYKTSSEAVIVSCFLNPQKSPYRLLAFQKWYHSIKHLNHRIVECVIGDAEPQLPDSPYITRIHSDSVLWHKESLINNIVKQLPDQFKYVFWVDADVLFTNQNWLVEGVEQLKKVKIIQPFEYCVHLERNQIRPRFDMDEARENVLFAKTKGFKPKPKPNDRRIWRSFCSNIARHNEFISHAGPDCNSENYDEHGHVGFAWGARRELLEACPLFDHALVGGADHIVAHAAAGHIPHKCIANGFGDNIDEVIAWSKQFYAEICRGYGNRPSPDSVIGYVPGDLYHIWHGDIASRQYLKRVKEFTHESKGIKERDKNGLHKVSKGQDRYVRRYFQQREVDQIDYSDFEDFAFDLSEFIEDMGYALVDMMQNWQNEEPMSYDEPEPDVVSDFSDESQPVPVDFGAFTQEPVPSEEPQLTPDEQNEAETLYQEFSESPQTNETWETNNDPSEVLPDPDEPLDVPMTDDSNDAASDESNFS